MRRLSPGGLVLALHTGTGFVADHGMASGGGGGSGRCTSTTRWHVSSPGPEEYLFSSVPSGFGEDLLASNIGQEGEKY